MWIGLAFGDLNIIPNFSLVVVCFFGRADLVSKLCSLAVALAFFHCRLTKKYEDDSFGDLDKCRMFLCLKSPPFL